MPASIYYEVLELIAGLTKRGEIVGVDMAEDVLDNDHGGSTVILAAQLLLNTVG